MSISISSWSARIQPNKINMDKFVSCNGHDEVDPKHDEKEEDIYKLDFAANDVVVAPMELPNFCGNINELLSCHESSTKLGGVNAENHQGLDGHPIRIPIDPDYSSNINSNNNNNNNNNKTTIATAAVFPKIVTKANENADKNESEHDARKSTEHWNDRVHVKQENKEDIKKEEDIEALEDAKELNALKCHMNFEAISGRDDSLSQGETVATIPTPIPNRTTNGFEVICKSLSHLFIYVHIYMYVRTYICIYYNFFWFCFVLFRFVSCQIEFLFFFKNKTKQIQGQNDNVNKNNNYEGVDPLVAPTPGTGCRKRACSLLTPDTEYRKTNANDKN
ncbi:mRNA splicing factor, Cwf18 family protein [Reticulomyxa filosa]|uniref:mRNA splicing factor, Cwf18 family protein n=1 Tax=Reticulomyxa filosa TaxID=46433 RepID=X6N661_RETFI|nr:mRNA splicing factor, Cwf18 family protein [Reticulomyxa filosa]|eukprot:ETO21775.1 mRNA splicing factor, Cwf18 family protein [Reticulomyxa filosa]